jgi:hypothetical protein
MSWSTTPSRFVSSSSGANGQVESEWGVVALPHHVVHVEEVAARHPELVVDEAGEHVVVEDLAGQPAAEVLPRPRVVAPVVVVDPLEEVRDPADPALGQGDLEVGERSQHR